MDPNYRNFSFNVVFSSCSILSDKEIEWIKGVKMWDIIVNSSDVSPDSVQRNVFFWSEGDPCPQPAQLNASVLEPCKFLKGYDYFAVRIKILVKSFYSI